MDVPMDNRDRASSQRDYFEKSASQELSEIEQARMTDNHNLEFFVMFVDYFELHLIGDYATTILELDTDTDLSQARHWIANKIFVLFHSMKALQSLKDERNNKSYLRLCTTKQTRSEKSCASSFLQSYLQTELRESDGAKS